MDKNVKSMDEIMGAVGQTDEWLSIQISDPMILDATKNMSVLLEQLKQYAPDRPVDAVEDAAYSLVNAYTNAAILYGIHVADAIRDVAARPCDLSRHVMQRMRGAVE